MITTYPMDNVASLAKPRMSQRDKWAKRPCVMRYRAACDVARALNITVHNGDTVTFILPMPASWSNKKRNKMAGEPHQVKPDFDNLIKGLVDGLYKDDAHLWDVRVIKRYGASGWININRPET